MNVVFQGLSLNYSLASQDFSLASDLNLNNLQQQWNNAAGNSGNDVQQQQHSISHV